MSAATKPQAANKPTLPPEAPISAALALLTTGKWTADDFAAWDASRSAAKGQGKLTVKHSDKGCVSVYGLNARFPVSLYPDQWGRLFGFREQIEAYINENRELLDQLGRASREAKNK